MKKNNGKADDEPSGDLFDLVHVQFSRKITEVVGICLRLVPVEKMGKNDYLCEHIVEWI